MSMKTSGVGAALSAQEVLHQRRLSQKDGEISQLQDRVTSLAAQLEQALVRQSASAQGGGGAGTPRHQQNQQQNYPPQKQKRLHPLSPHTMSVREVRTGGRGPHGIGGKRVLSAQKERLGRNASIATQRVLDDLHASKGGDDNLHNPPPVQRILDMFQHPAQHMDYLNSELFAKDLLRLANRVRLLLEREPRVLFLESPCYVFGDIHGNLEDLHFFSDNMWRLGMSLTAGTFLFLGDYVDRGMSCLEVVAYLLAMKYQLPSKVFLLRGNHETRDVNGWEEHYGERSFIYQCRSRFGDDLGYRLWEACNQVFDRMPLAAVIDQDIFCVHGGIPRPVGHNSSNNNNNNNNGGASASAAAPMTTRLQDILTVPRVAGINPPYQHEDDRYQQVASDCIWSDPASEEQELTVDPDTGFGQSLRGGGAICFGNRAVTDFLRQHDLSYILRAHEAHADGVAVSKEARVFTVFSTSKDHNQGAHAMAGCILVDQDKLQVINRSPAYKNQYVHRRDSVSLATLPQEEIQKRMRLGLVTASAEAGGQAGHDDDEELEDSWEDFEMEDDEDDSANAKEGGEGGAAAKHKDEYVFEQGRRSSVDLARMSGNSHDADADATAEAAAAAHRLYYADEPSDANKRMRSRQPSVSAIQEDAAAEKEDEDVATVDGDQDVELRDAEHD